MLINILVAIWLTSSLFMLLFHAITAWRFRCLGVRLHMTFGTFLYYHFCPIVHTVKAIKILMRIVELRSQREV